MVGHHAHAAVSGVAVARPTGRVPAGQAPAGQAPAGRAPADRVGRADLMQLVVGTGGAVGHVGAMLVLGTGPDFSVAAARRLLGERIRAIPRLRQRLRAELHAAASPA